MATQWQDIEDEVIKELNSDIFEIQSEHYRQLIKWGNRVITEICEEIDMKHHFQRASIVATTADASFSLPACFWKVSERFTKVRVGDRYIPCSLD